MSTTNLFIISLGGSLINPGNIDTSFLKKFKSLILAETTQGNKFIIVCGGGAPARIYLEGLKAISQPSSDDLDWMGIYATWTNAQLVRLMFGKLAHKHIAVDPVQKISFKEKVLVGGGWTPGRSTDDVTVRLAKVYGAKAIINLSNIDYVYSKDPNKFKDAVKIEQATWKEFNKVIGSKRIPGGNYPFDPVAAATAEKNKIKVIIANGTNLQNLKNILQSKPYIGTTIQ